MGPKQKLFLVVVIAILISSPLAGIKSQAADKAKWTFMVYVAANNNLEPNSVYNLMEMAAVGSSASVNIVVQITRPPDYAGYYGEWGGTRRFLVTRSDSSNLSSGDFQISPTRFIQRLKAAPADAGIDPAQIDEFSRMPRQQQEKTLLSNVPTIEPKIPMLPLQIQALEDLGDKVNSADSTTLAEFGKWAVAKYPAEHYGLVLWDHGGGWSMIASDDTLGPNGIQMPGLESALKDITAATGQPLDLIGFDACLMAQFPVAVTVAPYSKYMIAAEELVPGLGWDYLAPLNAIAANAEPPAIGQAAVDGFSALYTTVQPRNAGSFDMGLLDLSKVDTLQTALQHFAEVIKASTDDQVKNIGTARRNAQEFASVGEQADVTEQMSSVDLIDFMQLVGSLTKDQAVKDATKEVISAAKAVVLYHKASASLPQANGLSIFFPRDATTFEADEGARYTSEFGTKLPGWQAFLQNFYGTSQAASQDAATTAPLKLKVTGVVPQGAAASFQDVPVISFDTDGKNIVGITAYVLFKLDDKTEVVLDTFPVVSSEVNQDGNEISLYQDGASSTDFYWNATVQEITDGKTSLPVLMTSRPDDKKHGFIQGVFTSNGKATDAFLGVSLDTYEVDSVWAFHVNTSGPDNIAQITEQPGDTFEPTYRLIDAKGTLTAQQAGKALNFTTKPLTVNIIPAFDGVYTVVLSVNDAVGNSAVDTATLNIKNAGLDTSQRGFKDLGFGLKFLYPWAWTDVQSTQRSDGTQVLTASNIDGDMTINVDRLDKAKSLDAAVTAITETLNQLNTASVGAPEATTIGDLPAQTLTYKYTLDDGTEMDGTAVVVYVPDNKAAYAIELETPGDKQQDAQGILQKILGTLAFFTPTPQ